MQQQAYQKYLNGDYKGALSDFDVACKLDPNDSFSLKYRGVTKQMLGDYKGSLEDLNIADKLEPNDLFTLQDRGETKRLLGDYKGSLEDFNIADKLKPNDLFTKNQLELTRMEMSKTSQNENKQTNSKCEWKIIFPANTLFEIEGIKYIDILKLSPTCSEFKEVNENHLKLIKKIPNFEIKEAQWLLNGLQEQLFNNCIEIEKRRIEQNPFDNSLGDEQKMILSHFDKLCKETIHSEKVSILKVWHGTSQQKAKSIMKLGFINAATLDEGWFGKGVYFTTNIDYAIKYSMISSKSEDELCLLCSYVIISNPFPITEEMGLSFSGKGNYKHFQSHIVLVKSNTNNPNSMSYYPSSIDDHQYNEIVIFQESHILPRLQVVLKKKNNTPPQNISNSSNASSWSIDQVCEWISKIGLSQDYSSSIRINKIGGKALSTFKTKEDWKDIDIVAVGDVRVLCMEWNKLKFD